MINNIITNFDQILKFAESYNLPLSKKRSILREFLQVKILDLIYQDKTSLNLFFVGGTSLRLLRNLDRFSEDLDFDILGLAQKQINNLIDKIHQTLNKENISVNLYHNITKKRIYYELRFKDLFYQLNISANQEEKLVIKFDFETYWKNPTKEIVLLNRYGFLSNIITMPINQILVQKFIAYLKRQQTQPRDIYDTVWLISQGAKIDLQFMKKNKIPEDLVFQVKKKYDREKNRLKTYKLRIKPFLINENYVHKLDSLTKLL